MNLVEKELNYCEDDYSMSLDGTIFDNENDIPLENKWINDEYVVDLKLPGRVERLKVASMMAVIFLGIKLPSYLWRKIIPIYKDGNKSNVVPENISYRFDGLVEVKKLPGFYYIPFHTQYAINETGDVIRLVDGKRAKWFVTKPNEFKNTTGGYYKTRLTKDPCFSTPVSRHRLLCLTFKPYEVDPSILLVNHLNGIPGNDWLDNLEWSTHAKNNQHAYDNGLRPNGTRRISFKNWRTGETKDFDSIDSCSKYLRCSRGLIESRLRRFRAGVRYHDGFAFKHTDETPWPVIAEKVTEVTNVAKEIIARNVFTGKIFILDSALAAGKEFGISSSSIIKHARACSKLPLKGYNFRFFPSEPIWPNHTPRHLEIYREHEYKQPNGIVVTDIRDKTEMFFTSAVAAGKHFNIEQGQIMNRAKSGLVYDEYYSFSIFNLIENLGPPIE